MKGFYGVNTSISRLLVIFAAVFVYIVLLIVDVQHLALGTLPLGVAFGFSAFIALSFLVVGAFVWLFANDRRVAGLLFCIFFTVTVSFAAQTVALGNRLAEVISGVNSSLALGLCAILVLYFPRNYFTPAAALIPSIKPSSLTALLRFYITSLFLLAILALSFSIADYLWFPAPSWLYEVRLIYAAVAIIGILAAVVISYRRSTSLRERQSLRLFVGGVILSFAPFLLLTILPTILRLPARYMIPSQVSTLPMILFPLTLGYSILRYQMLMFDTYIRRAATWMVGIISFALFGGVFILVCTIIFSEEMSFYIIFVASISALLVPAIWKLSKVVTERLFFDELRYYHRLIDEPALPMDDTLSLEDASRLLTLAAVNTFSNPNVCLFVFEESFGYYRVSPELSENTDDTSRRNLTRSLIKTLKPDGCENDDWLEARIPAVERLMNARRPLLLSEVTETDQSARVGIERYLIPVTSPQQNRMLLAPVRVQGKMIGILVLGERSDHQAYAGPDLEAVQLLLNRFSSLIETARLYTRAQEHAALLNDLYSNMPEEVYQTLDDAAAAYTTVVAKSASVNAELWLYEEADNLLRRVTSAGLSSPIQTPENIQITPEQEWSSWFYEGGDTLLPEQATRLPEAILSVVQERGLSCAWLPMMKCEQRVGVLMLTYPRPHFFMKEEVRVWQMFAGRCAFALENTRMTIALRAAYERQKELDRLKDQFIMTASHELRTPLTAVQGYIELLSEYDATLTPDARSKFIEKARRGCHELALLVGNIIDASSIQIDVENIHLHPVELAQIVTDIVEILEVIINREQRSINVQIPSDMKVIVDDMRLRQVVLNLVVNALRYSPAGTDIEVVAEEAGDIVTMSVRDHGFGIPPEEQERLFERFVRLERDMNSPVRGAGLGLYICKQLVTAMGGDIWIESSGYPGEGSQCTFTLKSAKQDQTMSDPTYQHSDLSLL